ncbi:MAG TPA: serine/threonine-protein kinase [Polyangiaceae bacterium]|jgi:serine/threonine-protein kinase|nr:serine/threonine-protein kinase [Polyangiaceae bacterium]
MMPELIREGTVLAGKYRVERLLGQGGMGVVVAARHIQLGELVALKFLLPEMVQQAEVLARFSREARAAVRIKSEHVARVIDVGVLDEGGPYMVMEYLHGRDLGAVLAERGPLPIEEALDYVAQACEAVAEAHALGIIHRDLKPSNMMLVERSDGTSCVKVLDFGISKMASTADDVALAVTRTSMALGSPLYMSPEQMLSARDVDGRTDIWALGTILFELVTGRTPFSGESFAALVLEVSHSEPASLTKLRRDAPPALESVVARCLAKRREDRYSNVAELAESLIPFAPPHARLSIDRASRILRGSGPQRRDAAASGPAEPSASPSVSRSPSGASGSAASSSASRSPSSAAPTSHSPSGAAAASFETESLREPVAPLAPHSATAASWTQTAATSSKRRVTTWVLAALAFAAFVGGTLFTLHRSAELVAASSSAANLSAPLATERRVPPPTGTASTATTAPATPETAATTATTALATPETAATTATSATATSAPSVPVAAAPFMHGKRRGVPAPRTGVEPAPKPVVEPAPTVVPPTAVPPMAPPSKPAPKSSPYDDM